MRIDTNRSKLDAPTMSPLPRWLIWLLALALGAFVAIDVALKVALIRTLFR